MAGPITGSIPYKVKLVAAMRVLRTNAAEHGPRVETGKRNVNDIECLYLKSERRLIVELQQLLDGKP